MASIRQTTFIEINAMKDSIMSNIDRAKSFEEASQTFTNELYEKYIDSVVLVRVFATIRYDQLPVANKEFVDKLAEAKDVKGLIKPDTKVLTLLGTSGQVPDWNDRTRSLGHIGIPLVSEAFIESIPMMSRLLKQLGLGLEWIDSQDSSILSKTLGNLSSLFFVQDAATEEDQKGRKIISNQDFVAKQGVKTVFGFGGAYMGTGGEGFAITIFFLKETIEKKQAEWFSAACAFFKAKTLPFVKQQKFFNE